MTGKSKEDGDFCLNTRSGDTINDPKNVQVNLQKLFITKRRN
jgi:hypothetical protein